MNRSLWIIHAVVVTISLACSSHLSAQSNAVGRFLEGMLNFGGSQPAGEMPTHQQVRRMILDIAQAKFITQANMQHRAYQAALGVPTDLNGVRMDVDNEIRAESKLNDLINRHGLQMKPIVEELARDPDPNVADTASRILRTNAALNQPPTEPPKVEDSQGSRKSDLTSATKSDAAQIEELSSVTVVRRWTNTAGMAMITLPATKYEMGITSREELNLLLERASNPEDKLDILGLHPPRRSASVPTEFSIAAHEVTVAQFRSFVEATGYKTDAQRDGRGGTGMLANGQFGQSPHFHWNDCGGMKLTDDCPVVNVSWNDAQAYCQWLSQREEISYRLPTEAEWELAARGGKSTHFVSGKVPATLIGWGNVADCALADKFPNIPWTTSFDDGFPFLAPVGQFQANSYGLFDMHGNAGEWCLDRFSFLQPLGIQPDEAETMYVLRGGNWFNDPLRCGVATRTGAPPTHRMSLIGFRVVAQSNSAASR